MKEVQRIEPYEHFECPECQWVGWYSGDGKPKNVYLCGDTVIIRYSSAPSDYWAGRAGESSKGPLEVMT